MFRPFQAAFLLLASLLLLASCDRTANTTAPEGSAGGALAFHLSDSLVTALAPQADSVRVTVHRVGQSDRVVLAALGGWIQIDSLAVGSWDLEVDLYRAGGNLSWTGKTTVEVVGGRTVDAVVHLGRATGNVHVQVVIDTTPLCTASVVVVVDTVHVSKTAILNTFRRILSVTSDTNVIRVVVRVNPLFTVPEVLLVQGKDGISLEVGDPFFECGGIAGICLASTSDTLTTQTILVPWNEVPSCAGQVGVIGDGAVATAVSRPGTYCLGGILSVGLVWESTGGFAGGGTGERLELTPDGNLTRIVRDSLGRLDTTSGSVGEEWCYRLDTLLTRADVLGLPGADDTVGSVVADGFGEHFRVYSRNGSTLLDFSRSDRVCPVMWSAASGARALSDTVIQIQGTSCPVSTGAQALESLVASLRSALFIPTPRIDVLTGSSTL
jgi:hypothetical protein